MPKWSIGLTIFFVSLLGVLFTGYSVSAASVYDDNFSVAETLEIVPHGQNNTSTCDLSSSWGGITLHDDVPQSVKDLWNNREGWSVSRHMQSSFSELDGNRYYDTVRISYWVTGDSMPVANWTAGQYGQIATWDENYLITATVDDNCDLLTIGTLDYKQSDQLWNYQIADSRTIIQPFLTYNMDLNYPVDYEGEIVPDTYAPPAEPLNWIPDINLISVVDWQITLQDENFNTFDPVPFTCDEGLSPIIQYDLYNNDVDPLAEIDSGNFSPTIPYVYQSENYGVETEYKFVANYYCGAGDDEPTFSNQRTYYFTVNAAGLYVAPTDTCYTDSFPYIDMDGCAGVIEGLLSNLSFGTINLPNWSINSDGCHTLGIIGDWINVPDHSRTICPQFSAEVRNIVTPFLTFVLGLTIMGALVNKSRYDSH